MSNVRHIDELNDYAEVMFSAYVHRPCPKCRLGELVCIGQAKVAHMDPNQSHFQHRCNKCQHEVVITNSMYPAMVNAKTADFFTEAIFSVAARELVDFVLTVMEAGSAEEFFKAIKRATEAEDGDVNGSQTEGV